MSVTEKARSVPSRPMRVPPGRPERSRPKHRGAAERDGGRSHPDAGHELARPQPTAERSRGEQEEEKEQDRETGDRTPREEPVSTRKEHGQHPACEVSQPRQPFHLFRLSDLSVDATRFLARPGARNAVPRRVPVATAVLAVRPAALETLGRHSAPGPEQEEQDAESQSRPGTDRKRG